MDKYYRRYIGKHKVLFGLIVTSFCVAVMISIPIPLITKFLIDDVIIASDLDLLPYLCIIFVVLLIIQIAFGRFMAWLNSKFTQDFINELRVHIISSFLQSNKRQQSIPGKLMVVVNSDTSTLGHINLTIISTLCRSVFSILGYATMLFLLNPLLSAISLALYPLYFLWIKHISIKMQELTHRSQTLNEKLLYSIESIDKNIDTIKIYGYRNTIGAKFQRLATDIGTFLKSIIMYQNFVGSVSGVITSAAAFIPLIVGVMFIASGEMTLGDLIVFNTYSGMLFTPLSNLIELKTKTKLVEVHENRIDEILNSSQTLSETEDQTITDPVSGFDLGVELENFSLYSHQQKLLQITHFQIDYGITICIKGKNASGKSLLLKSIAGLYDSYSGSIMYKDKDIRIINQSALFQNILYVSPDQEFVLSTLKEELMVNSEISHETIELLLDQFGLSTTLSSLPEGVETPSAELHNLLNMGSMQKLKLIRALARNPKYILLDEMFSHIEEKQCIKILASIRSIFPNMTIVIVEHHLDLKDGIDAFYTLTEESLIRMQN